MSRALSRARPAVRTLGLVMIVAGLGLALATIPWSRVTAQGDMGVDQELVVTPGSAGTDDLPTGTWMLLHEGPQVLTDDRDLGPTVPPAVTVTGPDGAPVALDIQVTGPGSRPLTTTVYTEGEEFWPAQGPVARTRKTPAEQGFPRVGDGRLELPTSAV